MEMSKSLAAYQKGGNASVVQQLSATSFVVEKTKAHRPHQQKGQAAIIYDQTRSS